MPILLQDAGLDTRDISSAKDGEALSVKSSPASGIDRGRASNPATSLSPTYGLLALFRSVALCQN